MVAVGKHLGLQGEGGPGGGGPPAQVEVGAGEVAGVAKGLAEVVEHPAVVGAAMHYLMDTERGRNVRVMMPRADALAAIDRGVAEKLQIQYVC